MQARADRLLDAIGLAFWRRHKSAGADSITLDRPRLFILPTRYGLLFAMLLFVMLLGSINYNNSLAMTFTFLLGSLSFVSILHTYRNMAGLTFSVGKAPAVFVGEKAQFTVLIDNPTGIARYGIRLRLRKGPLLEIDVLAQDTVSQQLSLPTNHRGSLSMGHFRVSTRFPLGLFYTWAQLDLGMSVLVYPRPGSRCPPPVRSDSNKLDNGSRYRGNDDFMGLRNYQPGDSLYHVSWKASARAPKLLTKQFAGEGMDELWLDWDDLAGQDNEARLSQLCRWVLDAHAAGQPFGLRLPGKQFGPGGGEAHRHSCLAALALFKED